MLYRVEFIFDRPPTYCFILEANNNVDASEKAKQMAKRDRLPRWKWIKVTEIAAIPVRGQL